MRSDRMATHPHRRGAVGRLRRAILVTAALLSLAALPSTGRLAAPSVTAQDQVSAALQPVISGLPLASGVRYAVSLHATPDLSPTNVQVTVKLPADALVQEVLQTPQRTVFRGLADQTLSWAAPGYGAGEPIDPFAFTLAQPVSAPVRIQVRWESAGNAASADITTQPALLPPATTLAGEVILPDQGADGFVAVGDSGVQVALLDQPSPGRVTL